VSWAEAIKRRTGPSCLIFSRQNLAHQLRSLQQVADIARGAYVLFESKPGFCDVILVATGSEVELAVQAAKQLAEKGVAVRVVSMPSTTVFDRQDAAYRESVLPSACKRRVAVEAGTRDFWYKYVGLEGAVIGMNSFGASAPADQLYVHFGITVDAVVSAVEHLK
jgi:transketolase